MFYLNNICNNYSNYRYSKKYKSTPIFLNFFYNFNIIFFFIYKGDLLCIYVFLPIN